MSRPITLLLVLFISFGCDHGGGSGPAPQEEPPGDQPAFPFPFQTDQADITSGVIQFGELFDIGDELFEVQFKTQDGVGIQQLPDLTPFPRRFTRVPPGGGRFTGPNSQGCVDCHNAPLPTSAGPNAANVFQDPGGMGVAGGVEFNGRNTISLFGSGGIQRLAEEITEDLQAIRAAAAAAAVISGVNEIRSLDSKGVNYGQIEALPDGVTFITTGVQGVDIDLVIRPFGWKGNVTMLRDFTRGAARNEMGMDPEELEAKDGPDADGDGVSNELTIGDITAILVYIAAQEIPQETATLAKKKLIPPVSTQVAGLINQGRQLFTTMGCVTCHVPEMQLNDVVFEEPTLRGNGNYIDPDNVPATTSLDPANPFRFNLVTEGDQPRLEPNGQGGARVRLFSDLKRHDMGAGLADPQATPVSGPDGQQLMIMATPIFVGPQVFLTPELWGVGNSGPWLHDGRAASLTEAILLHGGDALTERNNFNALTQGDQDAVIEFLESLQLFAFEEEEE